MLEMYYKYRIKYNDCIIFIKVGNFYEVFDRDGLILNKMFGYKIKAIKNTIKVGFPLVKLNDILNSLSDIKYIVLENDNIVLKNDCNDNKYNNYDFDINKVIFNNIRLEKIYNSLYNKITDNNVGIILDEIESII